jgi:hypothetical protein
MPIDGIKFFFSKDRVLNEIMLEAPYAGSVADVQIGDSADDLVAHLGQPYAIGQVYDGSGYLYNVGGNILRYDVDPSKKVREIVQMLNR